MMASINRITLENGLACLAEPIGGSVSDHSESRYGLFLNISLAVHFEHEGQSLNDRIKVRLNGLAVHTGTEVDDGGRRVSMHSELCVGNVLSSIARSISRDRTLAREP